MYCENIIALNYGGGRPDGSHTLRCNGHRIGGHFFGQSSFGSYALANERNTVKVNDDAPLELVAPLGCGIQTGVGVVMRSLSAKAGRSIAIYGGGSVGLSAVMGAVIQGCAPIVLVEPIAARRALALEIGATHVIDPGAGDIVALIREIDSRGTDYAVDTTAAIPVLQAAMEALAPHGSMAWLGVPKDPTSEFKLSLIGFLTKGATLKAVIEGDSFPDEFIPELLGYYMAGRLPLEKLVKTYPFSRINEAIDDQLSGKTLKPVLTF
jgi:aryl-alcohol dehydrogenase